MATFQIICLTPKPGPFPADRRCAKTDCITVLSRYDPGPECFVHSEPKPATYLEQAESFEDLMAA